MQRIMSELGLSEVLTIAQTIGIVGTIIIDSVFLKTPNTESITRCRNKRVWNDLGEKLHKMGEITIEAARIRKGNYRYSSDCWSVELPFAYYVMAYIRHAYDMRE